jgi:hypothetical protein
MTSAFGTLSSVHIPSSAAAPPESATIRIANINLFITTSLE